jgi:hypothetical protein
MLYIGIAAAVVLAAGVVVLILVLRSGGSSALGTYKGALTDLLPNVASGYSRKSVGSLDDVARGMDRDARRFFGYDDAKAGNYEHEGKKMLIVAANFPSPDSAKAAFNKAKDEIARAAGQRTRWKIEDSGTRKNGGERAVYTLQPEPSSPEMTIVMWTNGSVVFAAGPAAVFAAVRESDFESSIPSRADVVDIEKSFPY